jgi:fused signal recognition particle receptor
VKSVLQESLRKTRQVIFGRVLTMLGESELNDSAWDAAEALLIGSDMGVRTAQEVVIRLQTHVANHGLTARTQLNTTLKEVLLDLLPAPKTMNLDRSRLLNVIVIVGVNGSGKTTTIAKLARHFGRDGWNIALAAADTFRAAATEQLQAWGQLLEVPVIYGEVGSDPAAVVYNAIAAARARNLNLLIVDTAGRLHTKHNLMEELKKVCRIAGKNVHDAPHEVWLVTDGTTGQNAFSQASNFKDSVGLTGVIVSKLDSTSKGGVIFGIQRDLGLPVRFVGVGEEVEDLIAFNPVSFVEGLISEP